MIDEEFEIKLTSAENLLRLSVEVERLASTRYNVIHIGGLEQTLG